MSRKTGSGYALPATFGVHRECSAVETAASYHDEMECSAGRTLAAARAMALANTRPTLLLALDACVPV